MDRQARVGLLIDAAWWILIAAMVYLVFQYLSRLLMPFALALLTAWCTRPLARALSRDTRMVRRHGQMVLTRRRMRFSRAASGVLGVLALLVPLAAGLGLLLVRTFEAAAAVLDALPGFYETTFVPAAQRLYDRALAMGECMDAPLRSLLARTVPEVLTDAGRTLSAFSGRALTGLTTLATRLPAVALDLAVYVIAAVFLAADYDRLRLFLRRNLPESTLRALTRVRASFTEMARRFARSYFLIFLITVGELALGLTLLHVGRSGLIALGIGALDAFPLIGSGLVLLPWAAVSFITGDSFRAAGLLALYFWVAVFRQFLEPRILGRHVGLRPVVTLLCMYAGARLFGGVGLVGLPVTAAILTDLNQNGVIRLFDRAGESAAAEEIP